MLFDPQTGSYLCREMPLLRRIPDVDYNPKPLEVVPPLRILGIMASPYNLPELDTDKERQHLEKALAEPRDEGRIELSWAPRATWDGVQSKLLAGPWHVVHFIGHGDYDTYTNQGRIALLGADGRAAMIKTDRLMSLLSVAAPIPRLVMLNSCSSGEAGERDLFAGTAAALVRSGISAVAAMQFTVSDAAAIAFSHGFYAALANGRSIDEAVRIGRISIMGDPEGTLEWVTPVLYVRGESIHLFTLTGPPAPSAPAPASRSDRPDRHEAKVLDLYIDARSSLRMKDYRNAAALFDDLLALDPDYHDAAVLRKTARHRLQLDNTYRAAREAEDAGDWLAASRGYALVQDDPDFEDA